MACHVAAQSSRFPCCVPFSPKGESPCYCTYSVDGSFSFLEYAQQSFPVAWLHLRPWMPPYRLKIESWQLDHKTGNFLANAENAPAPLQYAIDPTERSDRDPEVPPIDPASCLSSGHS